MSRGRTALSLAAILAAAALLRLTGIGWGLPSWFHPDERAIVMNAGALSAKDMNPHWFAYGSLPIYALKGATTALAAAGIRIDPVVAGRSIAALVGTATVLLLFLLARRLAGTGAGLLAAAFLALAATHVQNSHYYTVDVPLTFLVLLSLHFAVRLAETGRWRDVLLAGVGLGLAAATKVSSLPLVLPLLLAAWLGRGARGWRRAVPLAAAGCGAAVAACFLAMPYAFLDHRAFLKDVIEQANMASGRSFLPYTLQFMGTVPYLYPAEQLVRWSLGWPLGILAIAASAAAPLVPALRRRGTAVLYAFLVPFVAVNAGLFAKYPRYLLPAVPLMLGLAAAWLVALRRSPRPLARLAGAVLPWAVLIPSALWCAALLHVFTAPNPRIAASDYLHTYHAKGKRILTEHWDDRVPVTTSRGIAEEFAYAELPLYEPDTDGKWQGISETLAGGDLVVLASQRLAASIPRDPARYPMASNYHRALLAGDLGYRIEAVFTTYPRILGVDIRDDLADESIRVYDHPTVVILSRAESLAPGEIRRRIANPSEAALRLDLKALMSIPPANPTAVAWEEGAGSLPDPSRPMPAWRWGGQALAWILLLGLAGPLCFPLLTPFLGRLPDGGWIAARTAGPFLLGAVVWAGAARGWWGFTPLACWIAAGLLLLLSRLAAAWRPIDSDPLAAGRRGAVLAGEAVFWGTLLAFLAFKAWNPAVFWGEKPMNLSYLGSLIRSPHLPPPDPWFAGAPLNYYHLGHYFAALPAKMLGTDPSIAFNLASAAIPALVAALAFSLAAALTGRSRWGLAGAAFTVLLGNGATVVELVRRGREHGWGAWARWMNFDYFWAPSRVIDGTINEFPFWAYLFSDLHAHLLVMPLWALLLLAGWQLFGALSSGARLASASVAGPILLGGLVAVATYGVNPWSFPGAVLLLLLAAVAGGAAGGGARGALRGLAGTALALAAGAALFAPYFGAYASPVSGIRLAGRDTSPIGPFLLIWGYLLAILLVWLAAAGSRRHPRLLLAGLAAAAAAVTSAGTRFGIDAGALALAGAGAALAVVASLRRGEPAPRRYALLLAGFGLAMLAGCEVLFIDSRFNSVFKFHLQAWFPLAAAAAFACDDLRGRYRLGRAARIAVLVVFGAATVAWFQFVVTGTRGKLVDDKSIAGELPTLDGMEFLRHRTPEEWQALTWLREAAAGSPPVAEAAGAPYREYARVAMYTGLPSIVGWDYHLTQQGRPQLEVERRKADLRSLYAAPSAPSIFRPARDYGMKFIYVGSVERSDFGAGVRDSFAPLLPAVFTSGGTAVYEFLPGRIAAPRGAVSAAATAAMAPSAPVAEPPAPPVDCFTGGRGDSPGRFREPRGIEVTPGGEILVVDFRNARLQRFAPDGAWKASYGRPGKGRGEMNDPSDVAVGDDGRIYLLDTWNNRVQVLDDAGGVIAVWEGPPPGFYGPRGIAWSPAGIAVTDTGNNRVVLFSPDGAVRATVGAGGSITADLSLPVGIAWDGARFVVVDTGGNRLLLLGRDGAALGSIPVPGWTGRGVREAYVAVARDGRYLVTDPAASSLVVLDPKGGAAVRVAIPGTDVFPTGVAVARDGRALVVSTHGDRVIPVAVPRP